jgi:membrane peptidoglycan carboxypeptidase
MTLVCSFTLSTLIASSLSSSAAADTKKASHDTVNVNHIKGSRGKDKATAKAKASLGSSQNSSVFKASMTAEDWHRLDINPSKAIKINGKMVQRLKSGHLVTFNIEPEVQEYIEKYHQSYKVPYGGLVLIEPSTGRVVAMVSHTQDDSSVQHMALRAQAPSASVFKIVTAAALIESAHHQHDATVCYHGGKSHLTDKNILGDAKLDRSCGTLSDAVAWSINSMIAKLAHQKLSQRQIDQWSSRFGYNQQIPFEMKVDQSFAESLKDPLERARMAAGFWHSTLSPLHGAMIAASVQNQGVMMTPALVETVHDEHGKLVYRHQPTVLKKVMEPKTATLLYQMLRRTNTVGTARKYFSQRAEFPKDLVSGGKTGTLSRKTPYLGYTWYVGFAEERDTKQSAPIQVAVGGLICNQHIWHIKGSWSASEAIRKYSQVVRKQRSRKS